jgi:type IV secretion system protein VirB4
MLQLTKTRSNKDKYAKREYSASNFLPFLCHWNSQTILTKNEELIQVIRINGFSFETADDEDLDVRKNLRNTLFKGLEGGGITLYFHIIRRRESIFASSESGLRKAKPNQFTDYVEYEWQKKQLGKEAFVNELYITIIKRPEKSGAAFVEYMIKKLQQKTNKDEWGAQMRDMYDDLEETTGRIMATLAEYNPTLLSVVETDFGNYSQILEFFGKIVNCGDEIKYGANYKNIDQYLFTNRLYFNDRFVEVIGGKGGRYAGIVSIKEYGQTTAAGMFDGFLHMPFELIISHSFTFSNRQVAIGKMQLQQNRMVQAEDKAVSQIAEISEALDMAMSGKIGFGMHHMTVMCVEDSPKKLEYSLSQVVVELGNSGIQAVRERVNLEPAFWGQVPANDDYLVRKAIVNTLNLASFISLHNYPLGKADGNHWGKAVTILNTTSGTPYFFNFHLRDVGHTTIIGPTGSGKTVLMNFLCAQAQKFNCRMFFFDKDRGAEIFIRAINGVHTVIDPEKKCGFNPLKLPENGANKTFLLEWLKLLVSINKEQVTSEDIKTLSLAIEGNYKLKYEDRVLRNIVPFLGMATEGSLASRISIWCSGGSHAKVFDNDEDLLDFSVSSSFGFEMADLLKDTIALNPVLLYLFHRIQISLDGTPTMLVLDEAWALIDNPIFAPKIKNWLKVLRKLNAFVIFATQSVEDASKSDISDTLIQQTATQIFLPNLKATDSYRKAFMLSQREFSLIKTTDPGSRFFLIKQGQDAVVAKLDLRGMGDIVNVLSGRSDTVLLLYDIMKRYGENPKDWLPVFYKECKELQSKVK